MTQENQWESPMMFLFAMIGAAVGLGNIWRYSYVLYSNGGGSFFIPYLVAIAIMGIPFLVLEYGMGFTFKDSFSNIMKRINPKLEFISWMLVLFVFIISIYYMVIISWDLVYLGSSFTFQWGANSTAYFNQIVGGTSNLADLGSVLIPTAVCVLVGWIVVWYISHKDLNDGIGKFSKIFIPLLFVLMAAIIIYALTLPGSGIGIAALLEPDWSRLLDVTIWLAAFSQIIFSLSMGQAIAVTFASYLPEGSKLNDSVLMVVAANCSFEVCTAFGVFSILGYMSQTSGTPITQLVSQGTGLIFIVFPMIFNVMGVIGRILAPLLFVVILFAGISSAVGIFEPMVNSTMHKMGWSRKKAVTVLSIVGCLCSLLFTTGISSYLVGIVDGFVNNFGILLLVGLQAIIFTWFIDVDSMMPVLNNNSRFKVGKVWKFIVKYLLPVVIISMWLWGLDDLFFSAQPFELMVDAIVIVAVLVFSAILTKMKSRN